MPAGRVRVMPLEKALPLLVTLPLVFTPVVFGGSSAVGAKPTSASQNSTRSMGSRTRQVTGKVESLNAYRLTLVCQVNGKTKDMTFVLDPETQREGKLRVGSLATVKYRVENNQKIANDVTTPPPASAESKTSNSKGKT